ncbi:MAG: VacJ family lipoprotein [Pseudomonadota bacterium]
MHHVIKSTGLLAVLALSGPAWAGDTPRDAADPWESFNRGVFSFNETVDRYVAKPVAQTYQAVMPEVVDDAITRFFNNLATPITIVNQILQCKGHDAATQVARVMFNSTLGLAGIFDVAQHMDLPRQKEDFGQTLAVWGVKSGPYIMLPLLGPSTVRDTGGRVLDMGADPRRYAQQTARFVMTAVDVTDTRADLLAAEKVIEGDRYLFIRDYYLQQREFVIADGVLAKDEFLDDSLENDAASGTF